MDYLKIDNKIITIDNSVGIGMLEMDQVKCPYDVVAYYTLRTALIDNICAGGLPIAITFSNGCKDENYLEIIKGFNQLISETNSDLKMIGSSESNFDIRQSSLSVTVIGQDSDNRKSLDDSLQYMIVGLPLVGQEVIDNPNKVVSINEVIEVAKIARIIEPVGSKGAGHAISKICKKDWSVEFDLTKSGGPSTSVVIGYLKNDEQRLLSTIKTCYKKVSTND